MFSFFKNLVKQDQKVSEEELKKELREESLVDLNELDELEITKEEPVSQEAAPEATEPGIKVNTELSLHPEWEAQLDNEKKYTLRFLQAELPKMTLGMVGVTGFSLMPQPQGGVTVAMFFRNGSPTPVSFRKIRLTVYLDDTPFARMRLDLSDLGTIPPFSSRPWEVHFPAESFLHDNFDFQNWKVMLHGVKSPYVWPNELELDPEMEARMTARQKDRLEAIAYTLPPLKAGSVEITGFDIGKTKDGRLVIGLLFRNGRFSDFNPKVLKIAVYEKEGGDLVASGMIDAKKIRVRSKTSRPWMVVFPAEIIKKKDANLRDWYMEITT
ncbi:SLAP domain-containing protein [Brevibacillus ruminantium]|uniref:SLAP domain-containing protein n=1 Tax=Brevibacillus ruminantium TaxID=2950604 RepID=A0ABY4WJ09_9BACL|nr:SLAP domain-containing protein [Brevibacillus ruminantium]USG65344.1 SLAP domain-containing protein [Brevibacillus ruminantium]